MSAAIQTLWAELVATTLADAGAVRCVISPGSRSTPLVAALAGEPRLELTTLIDERAAGFFALGAARATGAPVALVCTSGTAAAHYLPAIVEASLAGVPLVVFTADRPPELQDCGASQTIDQVKLYGDFVRAAIDLGPPGPGELALRAVRRKIAQALTIASGPHPGPVHVQLPLRKPLEPAAPASDAERALAALAARLAGPLRIAPPRLVPDSAAISELAVTIAAEPDGVIVAGALPAGFAAARDAVVALARRSGYPIIAEAGSQLRLGPRPDGVVFVDHFDVIPPAALPVPRLVLQLGAEPVAAGWPGWLARLNDAGSVRCVLSGPRWHDADSSAHAVLLGDVAAAVDALVDALPAAPHTGDPAAWRDAEARATRATAAALDGHPRSEAALLRAALAAVPPGAAIQLGNSLPIRVVDWLSGQLAGGAARRVLTQRGAAGIDGLIASAAGATWGGGPVLLVLGDVSFAHDLGGLLAARAARAPLAILVIDNRGGQIFAGLPIAGGHAPAPGAFERHWITAPDVDPAAVAAALGARATTAASPAAAATAIAGALETPGVTVIHAPVSASGAHDVRRAALERFDTASSARAAHGGSHD
ncbi:MAG TPA: 2-succinyl-5-enolpyruvyl-6-hydroxy-3-cyclohexene-1-carboxylic-acid synthase [Kofleriaceae bacterium]|nr:2-succinyl-5-enolpyruvyl-6-hydroxy-3-cyclohexene-1-carboxylic-acid synthase [Kofleriaceae bacterium]